MFTCQLLKVWIKVYSQITVSYPSCIKSDLKSIKRTVFPTNLPIFLKKEIILTGPGVFVWKCAKVVESELIQLKIFQAL